MSNEDEVVLNSPAECWEGCNDSFCPYTHTPGVHPMTDDTGDQPTTDPAAFDLETSRRRLHKSNAWPEIKPIIAAVEALERAKAKDEVIRLARLILIDSNAIGDMKNALAKLDTDA